MWRRGANVDAVRPEETANGAGKKALIEVAAKALGESAGGDEEVPEGVDDSVAQEIRETEGPGVACGKINQENAILVAAWTLAIVMPDIDANGVEGARGRSDRAALGATLHC
jgi:hypothetical protein